MLIVVAACGGAGEPSRPASDQPPAPPSPIASQLPGPAAVDSVYAAFVPPTLCAMERRDFRSVLPELALVAAHYEKDDVRLDVNIGKVEDLEMGRGFYRREYQRIVRGAYGIFTRAHALDTGERIREACIILRESINVCASTAAMREPPDPAPCLLELDLAGLVELAAASGAPSGLNDLDFSYTDEQWKAHEESLRPGYAEYQRACTLHAAGKSKAAAEALKKAGRDDQPIDVACRMLAETRRDCEHDAFDERLAETDVHLLPRERANFRRTWEITCALAAKP